MAALYYSRKASNMETETTEPCLVDDEETFVSPDAAEEHIVAIGNALSENDPFGKGIQVHLLWDMLEYKSPVTGCQTISSWDDASTLPPTVTDVEDNYMEDYDEGDDGSYVFDFDSDMKHEKETTINHSSCDNRVMGPDYSNAIQMPHSRLVCANVD